MKNILFSILVALPLGFNVSSSVAQTLEFKVDAQKELKRLLQEQDIDHDKKITSNDLAGRPKGKTDVFFLKSSQGERLQVQGIYFLSLSLIHI